MRRPPPSSRPEDLAGVRRLAPVALAFLLLGMGIGRTLDTAPARARPVVILPHRSQPKDT